VQSYKMGTTQRTEIVDKNRVGSPGPGNYDSPSRWGKEGVSYTFQGKSTEKSRNENPGPGNYNATDDVTKNRVVSFKMGTTQRTEIVNKEKVSSPGPGNYDSPSKWGKEGVKYTFGEKREERIRNDSPGPGGYDANESLTRARVQSYKMGTTQRTEIVDKHRVGSPGPGNYDSPSRLGKDCATFTIGEKREEKIRGDSPGPGAYNANESVVKERVRSAKMSKTERGELVSKHVKDQPGPGNYDSPSKWGKEGVKYTFGEKREERIRNDSPGPGGYDANDSLTKTRV